MNKFFQAKAAMPAPIKDTKGFNYRYATLSQVKEIVDKACQEHGIGYVQYQDSGALVTKVLDIETGAEIVTDTRQLSDGTDQQRGSSETYQRRYALLTVFGLAPEDDDGEAASKPKQDQGTDALEAAKQRMWAALKDYAQRHNADPKTLLEGVQKRTTYAETVEFFNDTAYEFETAD